MSKKEELMEKNNIHYMLNKAMLGLEHSLYYNFVVRLESTIDKTSLKQYIIVCKIIILNILKK